MAFYDRALGWRDDLERRDELHATATPFVRPATFRAPETIDPRSWLEVNDQGNIGSCSGNAMSTCLEMLNWFDTAGKEVIQLSRMYAYLRAQTVDNMLGSDNGATISGAVEAAKRFGICREEVFPYPNPPRYSPQVPPAADAEAKQHKLLKHSVLNSYQDCYDWLATGTGAIEIGIAWRSSFANNKNGVLEQASGTNYGGHALAIVGYEQRADSQGRKYLIMANSHGRGWGKDGFALVNPALFDQWGRDSQSEMIGMTDLEEFKPRELDWLRAW